MTDTPITCYEDALLRAVNAAKTMGETLNELMDDHGVKLDEEVHEAIDIARADEEAAMAYLEANAPKCPGCRQAFAFQRQAKKPSRCSWCGYDHDTGQSPGLVPA